MKTTDSTDSVVNMEKPIVLYPPPMSTYEGVLRDLYIWGVQRSVKYGRRIARRDFGSFQETSK